MKRIINLLIFFIILTTSSYSSEIDICKKYSKFSPMFYKCKTGNYLKETKNYQKKEWKKEKQKIDNVKNKILK